jgi:ketosteroid isomerase-like protein
MDEIEGAFATRRGLLMSAIILPIAATSGIARSADFAGWPAAGEDNKRLVKAYLQACDAGDADKLASFISPDVKWWILARRQFDAKTIKQINEKRYPAGISRQSTIIGIVADGERVAVEYETETADSESKSYKVYHHLFIVRGGRFIAVNEYLDPPPLDKPFLVSRLWRKPPDFSREEASAVDSANSVYPRKK